MQLVCKEIHNFFFYRSSKNAYFSVFLLVVPACTTFSGKRRIFCVWCVHGNVQPFPLGPASRQYLRCFRHAMSIIVWTWCEKKLRKTRGNWDASMCVQHMHPVCTAGDDRCYAYFMLHNCVRVCHAFCWCMWPMVWAQPQRKYLLNVYGWTMWRSWKSMCWLKKENICACNTCTWFMQLATRNVMHISCCTAVSGCVV